ncbi:phytase [Chroogloeocystis siderophila]|jgi:myo-inositol-hexaphosphate 3-phosphohydrolase|uniref:Phytase n=1 Tax=Chroogloeocystis siderophila 5.2 s.c.1 TaxID=247279 RepID=A0A1U7HUW9_9CHRO|nr:phytase [Chroogloeocystis siderophila]OKH27390.1 phytase [Chroogloeocystis siderophila 5.2 s.c.1]
MTTPQDIRFASFNASLNRNEAGQLISDLSTKTNTQARNIAEIIQRTNPDVILINEFDYDPDAKAAQLFQQNYLAVGQNGANPIEYPYYYVAPSNTGVSSGFDLDNDGTIGGPNDALGFGFFPGQYGMVLYSKHPIDEENIRTFQKFLWKDMPNALLPDDWYSPEELEVFRLSSKSHWDIPIQVNGETIHVLASHPTPPVFDGEEDRNGRRNHDEIRFWSDYFTPGKGNYIYDDAGKFGGLTAGSRFVVMGDQNADPFDGDSTNNAIWQLLGNPLINTRITPNSEGGVDAAIRQGGANDDHISDPAYDTADFADTTPGNLRVDYVLPSQNLEITDASVFWKTSDDPLFRLVGDFDPNLASFPSSDHRLVAADVRLIPAIAIPDVSKKFVVDLDFIGEVTFDTGLTFQETEVGGLSGIVYDPAKNLFYSISDDRSSINPARFYTLEIDLTDGKLQPGDIKFQNVITLLNENGQLFAENSLDPEGITLTHQGTLFISSEGDTNQLIPPFVNQFSIRGKQFQALPVPSKYLPTRNQTSGIRNNLAFESLTITPNNKYLYTATENALIQDGSTADLENGSPSRILQYNLFTGKPQREFLYVTDPVAAESVPPGEFQTNGLVDLLAIDNNGTLLALERSFSTGVGNTIKLYEVQTQNALDIRSIPSVDGLEIAPVQKRLLLDFAELETPLDNIEGVSFGPQLPDGRQSLVVVSDNNFSDTQFTQFLAFAVDLDTTPGVVPIVETPPVVDSDAPVNSPPGDADDPAIYVHPVSALSLVIGSLKDGGLAVYDLEGKQLQTILPGEPGDVRYNNVDLLYGFKLGDRYVDLAIASDRNNDTLAIFQIDPTTRQLKDITAGNIPASIFGIDDGEKTAYGLATYTGVSGKSYVFVSQRESNQVAQLELIDNGFGKVTAKTVRNLTLPIPDSGEADAQIEGMVADRELGYLYVGQEKVGIWKFAAEVTGGDKAVLVDAVKPEGSRLTADVEGLTIYYAGDGKGYLLASSQGDNTFAVYSREGNNEYLGNFVIGEFLGIDGVQESDGADVVNVALGANFPKGMLVVQDGNNDPAVIVEDEGELENASSNFKFIPWENVANAFADALIIDPNSYNPRESSVKEITGTPANDKLVGTDQRDFINGLAGNDTITGALNNDLLTGGGDRDFFIINQGDGIDTITDFQGVGTGNQPIATAEVDTIQFLGAELTARNMLLTQQNDDLLIHFESDDSTQVILQNFDLENLENLKIGNLLFYSQSEIQDSFDVFDANAQRDRIFNPNSVTFLNDLDNCVKGYNYSHDVINGQGGNDRIFGLSGDDLLRGGRGNDTLIGGLGEDTLIGDSGSDVFVLNDAGFDIIRDFNLNHGDRIGLTHNLTFEQVTISQGTDSNVNNTILSFSGQEIALLVNVTASSLSQNNFIFV